jgi:2-methylcitrate dehydratase PrpD
MTGTTLGATRAMASFAAHAGGFPALARARARDALTDCVGCMVAGSAEPLARPMRALVPSFDSASPAFASILVGTGRFAAPSDAALYNGTIAHALDFDDTNHPAYAHPSAVLAPALLAVAPLVDATGADLVTAYNLGFEVFGKLGRAMNTQHYKRGWHATSSFGALAAAVAAGRLLELDERRMAMALGIAASAACGLRANFGSMVKPLHAGYAARNGVAAALLAREGFESGADVLEHRFGYLAVFNDGIGHDPAPLLALGESLEILTEHGLALKAYPACGATHPGIEAALQLREAIGNAPIRSVRAGVCEMALSPLIHVVPDTPLAGKFSLHFCIAAALLYGRVGLDTFSSAMIADPRIHDLIARISMEVDERWRDDSEFCTEVEVLTMAGQRHAVRIPLAAGKPARWMTEAQMREKFDDCSKRSDRPVSTRLYPALRALDSGDPAGYLLTVLAETGFESTHHDTRRQA